MHVFIEIITLFDDRCFRKKNAMVHKYNKGFNGFAARLSAEEARSIAHTPGVVSVFPDPIIQLHTTHSWDFLKYQTDVEIDGKPASDSTSTGADTIIGFLDTGKTNKYLEQLILLHAHKENNNKNACFRYMA